MNANIIEALVINIIVYFINSFLKKRYELEAFHEEFSIFLNYKVP
jgi:hypothetical protein